MAENDHKAELEEKNEKAKAYNKTKPAVKMKTLGTEITIYNVSTGDKPELLF